VPTLSETGPPQTTPRQHVLGRLRYSQSPGARWLRRVVAVLAIALGLLNLKVPLGVLQPEYVYTKDFLQEYTMSRAMVDRIDPYLPTDVLAARYSDHVPKTTLSHPTPHPPTLGILVLPLALLDYPTAAAVWFGLEIVCLLASVYLLARAVDARLSTWATLGIATALLIWYPFWGELTWGQLQVPVLALLAGAWVALGSDRPALGGALVGLAILVKPVPLPLLLLFVLRRDWRALVGAGSVIFAGYLVAAGAAGLDTLGTYFTTVLPLVTRIYRASWGNISISSLGWRLFYGTGAGTTGQTIAPPLVKSTVAAQVASLALPGLLLLVASWAVRKQRSLGVSLGVMMGAGILLGPISWPHYLVLATMPAAHVIRWLVCHRFPARETNLALIVTILLIIDWVRVARFFAVRVPLMDGAIRLPFALAQLPLMTAVAVGALAWLVASLGPAEPSMPAALEE
jgi:alpha-1,2-mannosyltransferase